MWTGQCERITRQHSKATWKKICVSCSLGLWWPTAQTQELTVPQSPKQKSEVRLAPSGLGGGGSAPGAPGDPVPASIRRAFPCACLCSNVPSL